MSDSTNRSQHDARTLYCRKLGHEIKFHYCRNENSGKLCTKIRDCWFEVFDIDEYLTENYATEDIAHLFKPPTPKIVSIFELIQKAQNLSKEES